jgi:hypothetical protein
VQNTLAERALEGLHDYAIYLRERGDRSDVLARTRVEREVKPRAVRPEQLEKQAVLEAAAVVWENARLRDWRAAGRLTSDGRLRVDPGPAPRWTLTKIARSFPELTSWDRWAVLIVVDGIFRRDEMAKDPHQNIREVIEEIVDVRLTRVLREELAAIFGEVLVQVKADAPLKDGERSTLTKGRKHQVHRVRHPLTKKLVSKEERDAYLVAHPEAGQPAAAAA